jgi:hypothetical protein
MAMAHAGRPGTINHRLGTVRGFWLLIYCSFLAAPYFNFLQLFMKQNGSIAYIGTKTFWYWRIKEST